MLIIWNDYICERHWESVGEGVVKLWTQKGIFVRMRRAGEGEGCVACEHYRVVEAGGIERRAA